MEIEYEPDDIASSPDFRFHLSGKLFHIEVKTLIQALNEETKKKIISQINDRIAPLTNNVIEIWLSENIEPKKLHNVVDWISSKAVQLQKTPS
jgi:hypothetical protein